SRKPRFHRLPQNSLTEPASNGACMIGRAFTPRLCQNSASNLKLPKCKIKATPNIPVQPCNKGRVAGKVRAPKENRDTPSNVVKDAFSHAGVGGCATCASSLRNDRASMPGHASR